MSKYDEKLLVSVEHGELMHKIGLEFGRTNAFNDITLMLINGSYETGLDAAQAVMDMQVTEIADKLKGENDE